MSITPTLHRTFHHQPLCLFSSSCCTYCSCSFSFFCSSSFKISCTIFCAPGQSCISNLIFSYALLNRNSSLRESKIRITEICSSNPFRKYHSSNRLALLQRITRSSNISSLLKIRRSLSTSMSIIASSADPSHIHALYFANSILLPP